MAIAALGISTEERDALMATLGVVINHPLVNVMLPPEVSTVDGVLDSVVSGEILHMDSDILKVLNKVVRNPDLRPQIGTLVADLISKSGVNVEDTTSALTKLVTSPLLGGSAREFDSVENLVVDGAIPLLEQLIPEETPGTVVVCRYCDSVYAVA